MVAPQTFLVAEDGTGTAGHVELDCIVRRLVPTHEASVGMCGAPHADNGGSHEGGQVHVGAVHAHHNVEVAHEDEFLREAVEQGGHANAVGAAFGKSADEFPFLVASAEEEDAA